MSALPSHARPSKRALAEIARQVENLAGGSDSPLVYNWVLDTVEAAWQQTGRPVATPNLIIKAFKAARTLDEVVHSLNRQERKQVDRVIALDPRLAHKTWLRGATGLFELDELLSTVRMLNYLFSNAANKTPPGVQVHPADTKKRNRRRRGSVENPAFHRIVFDLLLVVNMAGGELILDKNRYFHPSGGSLVAALEIIRPNLPSGMIPDDLKRHLSTMQRIKTRVPKNPWAIFS